MTKQEVLCSVRSCFYNGSGLCKASQIQINPNPATLRSAHYEFGAMGDHAQHSMQTLCETFVPQDHFVGQSPAGLKPHGPRRLPDDPKPGVERMES